MIADDARVRLAGRQRDLLAALAGGAHVPEGFGDRQLEIARLALIDKRWRNVAGLRPALVRALGVEGRSRFASYASTHPLPAVGVGGDALQFWAVKLAGTPMPLAAALEQAEFSARIRVSGGSAVRRRGPFVALVRGMHGGRAVVARVPPFGAWVVATGKGGGGAQCR